MENPAYLQNKLFESSDIIENTFDKTYNRLILEVENLFCENLDRILSGDYVAREQRGVGTFHRRNDLPSEMIDWGADIQQTILNIDQKYKNCLRREQDIIDEIQAIRSQNNVNWMDLLRIALAHAPLETKRILRQINQDDSTISQLLKDLGK